MLVALGAGYLLTDALTRLAFLIPKRRRRGDLLLFPYYPEGDRGARSRFHIFFPFFQRDGLRYRLCVVGKQNPAEYGARSRPHWADYGTHVSVYYRRLAQVLAARHYKAVFIQRGLFPRYPTQRVARLSRLLRTLSDNITIDFYDADYVSNPEIVASTVAYADKITAVNAHLVRRFAERHPRVFLLPMSVDADEYLVKKSYALGHPITLFWWGSPGNAEPFQDILPALQRVGRVYPLRLVFVSSEPMTLAGITVIHHRWDPRTAFSLLAAADIAVFPARDSEHTRGGQALKVLDYMAAAVPVVASPYKLSPHARDEENIFLASTLDEWEIKLTRLIESEDVRRMLGQNGRAMVLLYHEPERGYSILKRVIFS